MEDVVQAVLTLLNYEKTDENGTVRWKDGEEWRGVTEWARHEGIEANISGDNHTKERLLWVAYSIAKKHLKASL